MPAQKSVIALCVPIPPIRRDNVLPVFTIVQDAFMTETAQLADVVTLNVWGRSGAWDARRSMLIDGMRALRPDLVMFVETIKNDEYDQAVDLLGMGYDIVYQWASDHFGVMADLVVPTFGYHARAARPYADVPD